MAFEGWERWLEPDFPVSSSPWSVCGKEKENTAVGWAWEDRILSRYANRGPRIAITLPPIFALRACLSFLSFLSLHNFLPLTLVRGMFIQLPRIYNA